MPTITIHVQSVSEQPETFRTRRGQTLYVWTILPVRDDSLPIEDDLAGYQTTNHWIASLCKEARGRAVELIWKDSPWHRDIVEARLLERSVA